MPRRVFTAGMVTKKAAKASARRTPGPSDRTWQLPAAQARSAQHQPNSAEARALRFLAA
ncbi:hypothetical protein [Nocardia sp. NPDC004604]|uniref:hypothetical protein n=1 Tax=Nocardia sp. NPDC004604 TaxID=3157013 RepID=UPI0033A61FD1